jgi:hypothetical protein
MFTADAVADEAFSLRKLDTDLFRVDISIVELDEDFDPQSPTRPAKQKPSCLGMNGSGSILS